MTGIEMSIIQALSKCGGKSRCVSSATVIGEVLAKYCAIGDEKIYSAIRNMAKQDDSPILIQAKDKSKENVFELAYRYTEVKLSKFGEKSRFSKI